MELLLMVGVVGAALVLVVARSRSRADTSRAASTDALHAYVDTIDESNGGAPDPEQNALFDAAQEMAVDDIEMEADSWLDPVESADGVDEEAEVESSASEIEYAELLREAPDYVPDDLVGQVADDEPDDQHVDDPVGPEQTSAPLAQRTPKERSDERVGGGELRMAQTNQRPAGRKARSPEEVRSLLSNYRGGLERGRGDR